MIAESWARLFERDGYVVFERSIPDCVLEGLRTECDRLLEAHMAMMSGVGAITLGLSQHDARYFVHGGYEASVILADFLHSPFVAGVAQPLLGDDIFLFLELFVIKPRGTGTAFAWHQDSGYLLATPHRPYVTLWCALDDMTEENGALHVLPFGRGSPNYVLPHFKKKPTNDLVGYCGEDPGIPLCVPAGSIVALSSLVLHGSGPNASGSQRRAYLAAYSAEPILTSQGKHWNRAEPLLRDGQRCDPPARRQPD